MLEDAQIYCALLINRLRKTNPALTIVAMHTGDHPFDLLYSMAGADYVIKTSTDIFDDEFPRFLKRLLAS